MKTVTLALALLLLAVPALADSTEAPGVWTIGPNIGIGVVTGGGSSLVSLSIPTHATFFFGGVQPGLRIGYVNPGGGSDIYLDTDIEYASTEGTSFYGLTNTLNFQKNFSPRTVSGSPYLTGGAGFKLVGGDGDSQTNAILGVGLGVRRAISDRHGAVRSELRYDRVTGANGDPALNSFTIKFGVDVWIP